MTTRRTALALLLSALLLPAAGRAAGGPTADFSNYVTIGGRVLFFGFLPEGDSTQCGLWTVDPLSGAAERLAELCPDAGGAARFPLRWLATGSAIGYLSDTDGQLWRTDGTAAGTVRLADTGVVPPSYAAPPLDLTEAAGRIVFTALDPAAGRQPFISDLTPEGTHLLAEPR